LNHIQSSHFKKIIVAIFKLHTVFPGPFRRIYQLPAFGKCQCSRNFHSNMLSVFHGINSHWSMQIPVSTIINEIHIRSFTDLFPIFVARVSFRHRFASFLQYFKRFIDVLFHQITKGYNFNTFKKGHSVNCSFSPHSKPYNGYSYRVYCFCSQFQDMFLSCGPFVKFTFGDFYFICLPGTRKN